MHETGGSKEERMREPEYQKIMASDFSKMYGKKKRPQIQESQKNPSRINFPKHLYIS